MRPALLCRISFIVVLFIAVSCSKENDPTPQKSIENELLSVKITKAGNPQLSKDAFVFKFKEEFYITLPPGSNLSGIKVEFEYSPKATLLVDNRPVNGTSDILDVSQTLNVVVRSEAGSQKKFVIMAHEGIRELDELIYNYKTRYDIAGVSYAISSTEKSEILYKKGIGFAIVEEQERVRPDHLFRLASVSKQFTALCVMKLVDEGLLSVEDKVFGREGILKDEFNAVPERATLVTVRHLLDHTSGWTSNPDPMFTSSFRGWTLHQLIQHVLGLQQNIPGAGYSYYNLGYGMLGMVIEKVTGKPYEVYLKEVLAKAGISDIHVGGDRSGRRPNEVVYYSQDGTNGYGNNMEVIAAAGGVIASTEQMLKLLTYIDGRNNVPDILSPETRKLMFTKSSTASATSSTFYALGWRGGHRLFPDSFYHGGNLAGTATMWVVGPQYNVVLLLNSRSYKDGFDDNMYYLMEDLLKTSSGINL